MLRSIPIIVIIFILSGVLQAYTNLPKNTYNCNDVFSGLESWIKKQPKSSCLQRAVYANTWITSNKTSEKSFYRAPLVITSNGLISAGIINFSGNVICNSFDSLELVQNNASLEVSLEKTFINICNNVVR